MNPCARPYPRPTCLEFGVGFAPVVRAMAHQAVCQMGYGSTTGGGLLSSQLPEEPSERCNPGGTRVQGHSLFILHPCPGPWVIIPIVLLS